MQVHLLQFIFLKKKVKQPLMRLSKYRNTEGLVYTVFVLAQKFFLGMAFFNLLFQLSYSWGSIT